MVETLEDAVEVLNRHKYELADGPPDDQWIVVDSNIKRLALAQNKVIDETDAVIIARGLECGLECPMCGARNAFTIDPQDGSRGYCKVEDKTWVVILPPAVDWRENERRHETYFHQTQTDD